MTKLCFYILFTFLSVQSFSIEQDEATFTELKLNTSNAGKLREFQNLFLKYRVKLLDTQFDIEEIDADPITVIAHKASQLDELILIDDTSLDIEDATVGVNIRWLIDHLNDYIGHKAIWRVLLAYRTGDQVFIYKGEIHGTIAAARGYNGFGFDPFFLPEGAEQTLAEFKPDEYNARALAVDALMKGEHCEIAKAIYEWDGPWQSH